MLRKPEAYRFSTYGLYTFEKSPHIAAHFFAVTPIFFCFDASLYDDLSCLLFNNLNKYISDITHITLIPLFIKDHTRGKQPYRYRTVGIFLRITAELPSECTLISIHTSESHIHGNIQYLTILITQSECRLRQFETPDINRRSHPEIFDKKPS